MPRTRKTSEKKQPTLYVLDTNVLLHDPFSLFKFKDNDIYIPFVTIEELDNKKSGTSDVNRNARQATRLLDAIVTSGSKEELHEGYSLKNHAKEATGRLYVQTSLLDFLSNEHVKKNDNMYLSVLDFLKKQGKKPVMVTKDLNLRIKAKALEYEAEDYKHDHAVEDSDFIYKGWRFVPEQELTSWMEAAQGIVYKEGSASFYKVKNKDLRINEYLVVNDSVKPRTYRVISKESEDEFFITTTKKYDTEKNSVLGVVARNEEQSAAMDLLMNPDIDLVCLLGPAGTGKTLLALATSLQQVSENKYDDIIFTRANIPLGEDIGFLPGNEEEKMAPWLGALYDNIDYLCEKESPAESQKLRSLADDVISIRAVSFMRGRTFQKKILILDEAQNLTPKQMKALVTRCGEGTKLIALGNLAQIDSPYLSETSSGLAYLVERFKGWEGCGSLVLEKGVRSRLANEGNERL